MIQEFIMSIIGLVFGILDWLFGLLPDITIPLSWVPYAKGLLDWASYFLPVDTVYMQFKIVIVTLFIYIIMRLIKLIRSH